MIYIDPPYNTGHDFLYKDNFSQTSNEYNSNSGQYDNQGNRLETNTESDGKFHTNWLNMMYPRLRLAKDLLSDDGVIFISIDENEQANLKKICDEIFGEKSFIGEIIRKTKTMTADNRNGFNFQHEMLVIYARNKNNVWLEGEEKSFKNYTNSDNDPNGDWCSGDPSAKSGGESLRYPIENPYTHKIDYPPKGRFWAFSKKTLQEYIQNGRIKFKKDYKEGERGFIFKRYRNTMENDKDPLSSLLGISNEFMNQNATNETKELFGNIIFDYPKPIVFLEKIINSSIRDNSIILDFFSGSATTAHAVMKLNAEDGGHRKFIMVQIPEKCDEKSEAYKAGYKNICEIGKERIRRAGKQILDEMKNRKGDLFSGEVSLDIGFRDLKLDSSNMNDVYYTPEETDQRMLNGLESNIKADRSAEDLLFQVMLDLGVLLSAKIVEETISGKKIFNVDDNYLIACFDEDVDEAVIMEVANKKPTYFVMRDSSLANDSVSVNFDQIFMRYSPDTVRKVL